MFKNVHHNIKAKHITKQKYTVLLQNDIVSLIKIILTHDQLTKTCLFSSFTDHKEGTGNKLLGMLFITVDRSFN